MRCDIPQGRLVAQDPRAVIHPRRLQRPSGGTRSRRVPLDRLEIFRAGGARVMLGLVRGRLIIDDRLVVVGVDINGARSDGAPSDATRGTTRTLVGAHRSAPQVRF